MNAHVQYNRLRGKALYMEVRDLITAHGAAVTNHELRNMLAARYGLDRNDTAGRHQLYTRVARATEQLHQDGYLMRREELGMNRHIRYLYSVHTPNPSNPCSASTQ